MDTPRPSPRTNRTRGVPHPVPIGRAASLTPYHPEQVLRVEALQELGFGPAEARAALAEAAGNLEVAAALLVEPREARADPGG